MAFEAYKPNQAKTTRTVVFLVGVFLILWGCTSLVLHVPRLWSKLGQSWNEFEFLGNVAPADRWRVDLVIFERNVSPALTLALVVLVLAALWWWRFLNTPKWADLLIEMEAELRKVSWPTPADAWQSTLVVTGFTVALVATMFVYDLVIRGLLELIAGGAA